MNTPDLDGDIQLRENLGGWLRLALIAAVLLLLPSWLFASAAIFERMELPASLFGALAAGTVGAVLVLALVPVPLLLLLGGAALNAVQTRWELRNRRLIDEAVDRDAVMTGVAITSRVIGSPISPAAAPPADLAPISARIGAAVIDTALGFAVVGAAGGLGLLVGGGLSSGGAVGAVVGGGTAGAVGVALGALAFGALQAVGLTMAGQTVGKRLLGIRIVGEEGQDVGLVDAVMIRYVAWGLLTALPVIGGVLSVADVWALLTDSARQTLHDQLARTLVVRVATGAAVVPPSPP